MCNRHVKVYDKRDTRALIEKVKSVDFEYLQTPIGDTRCHFHLPLVAKSLNKPNKPLQAGKLSVTVVTSKLISANTLPDSKVIE